MCEQAPYGMVLLLLLFHPCWHGDMHDNAGKGLLIDRKEGESEREEGGKGYEGRGCMRQQRKVFQPCALIAAAHPSFQRAPPEVEMQSGISSIFSTPTAAAEAAWQGTSATVAKRQLHISSQAEH